MPDIKRRIKDYAKDLLHAVFVLGQRFGVDILPRHFYSEIPDLAQLRRADHWKAPYSMVGVNGIAIPEQLAFVNECCAPAIQERMKASGILTQAFQISGEEGFGLVEADFLFAYVASCRPRRIFQIGCGVSTAICLMAAEHAGYVPELICVEPYPTAFLTEQARLGKIKLIADKAQTLDPAILDSLGPDLLFFVDSSHTLGPAGEVGRIILEMLPRLAPGARVHFHDIYFPYDYGREVLRSGLFFWHESVLLHGFLAYNGRFRIMASLSMLHYAQPDALKRCLPNYDPAPNDQGLAIGGGHFPSSIYLHVQG